MLSGTATNLLKLLSHTSLVDEGICMKKVALKKDTLCIMTQELLCFCEVMYQAEFPICSFGDCSLGGS